MSSASYKIWIRREGTDATWSEITRFTTAKMRDAWSGIPSLTLTAYDAGTLRDRFVANAIVRVTKKDGVAGSEGYDGTRILDFFVTEANGDDKTIIGAKPSVWMLKCMGPGEYVRKVNIVVTRAAGTYSGCTVFTNGATRGTLSSIITYYLNDATDGYNIRSGGAANEFVAVGTVDTPGINISVKAKNEKLWDHLMDISWVGDTTTDFPLQVWCDFLEAGAGASRTFTPRVHVLRSDNTTFAFPASHTGYFSTDPFLSSSKYLDELAELTDVNIADEKDRIVNRTAVRFAGAGTQLPQGTTNNVDNATSQAAFGILESRPLAPWCQVDVDPGTSTTAPAATDSPTATQLATTIATTFSGVYDGAATGIKRGMAFVKWGELYRTTAGSDFDAILGDRVGILARDGTTELIDAKLLGWAYDQDTESVTYQIGLPEMDLDDDVRDQGRKLAQRVNNMTVTSNAPSTSQTSTNVSTPSGGADTSGAISPTVTAMLGASVSAGTAVASGASTSATDSSASGDSTLAGNEAFAVRVYFQYDSVGGEADPGDWHLSLSLTIDTVPYVFFSTPVRIAKNREYILHLHLYSKYIADTYSTGTISEARLSIVNTGAGTQTIADAQFDISSIPLHTHSTPNHTHPAHTHDVSVPAHEHNA